MTSSSLIPWFTFNFSTQHLVWENRTIETYIEPVFHCFIPHKILRKLSNHFLIVHRVWVVEVHFTVVGTIGSCESWIKQRKQQLQPEKWKSQWRIFYFIEAIIHLAYVTARYVGVIVRVMPSNQLNVGKIGIRIKYTTTTTTKEEYQKCWQTLHLLSHFILAPKKTKILMFWSFQ